MKPHAPRMGSRAAHRCTSLRIRCTRRCTCLHVLRRACQTGQGALRPPLRPPRCVARQADPCRDSYLACALLLRGNVQARVFAWVRGCVGVWVGARLRWAVHARECGSACLLRHVTM